MENHQQKTRNAGAKAMYHAKGPRSIIRKMFHDVWAIHPASSHCSRLLFEVLHLVIGTCFDVETYAFFQPNLDRAIGGKQIPFIDLLCTATAIQDLLLINYHGMESGPSLQDQWNNYVKMREQGITIQTMEQNRRRSNRTKRNGSRKKIASRHVEKLALNHPKC